MPVVHAPAKDQDHTWHDGGIALAGWEPAGGGNSEDPAPLSMHDFECVGCPLPVVFARSSAYRSLPRVLCVVRIHLRAPKAPRN